MTKKLIISIQISLFLVLVASHAAQLKPGYAQNSTDLYPKDWPHIHANVLTDFNENISLPQIEEQAFIHPFGIVIGNCYVGKLVFVAPTAVCRGDEGTPIHVGDFSNMQDGVVLHGLETSKDGKFVDNRRFSIEGERLLANNSRYEDGFSVFIGQRTSLAHDSLVHGPAWIGNDTFIGMKSLIFDAKVGNNVAIGVSSTITGGVKIPDNKFVPPGSVITTQEQANELPERFGTSYENINEAVIHVNEELANKYNEKDLEKLINQREKEMERNMLETSMPNSEGNK
jgi:carbon dioxide concentrating mechanism protein CcmM